MLAGNYICRYVELSVGRFCFLIVILFLFLKFQGMGYEGATMVDWCVCMWRLFSLVSFLWKRGDRGRLKGGRGSSSIL